MSYSSDYQIKVLVTTINEKSIVMKQHKLKTDLGFAITMSFGDTI